MAQISIRIDDELREQTDKILGELGLSISVAVSIFARQIVRSRGIPFQLTLSEQRAVNRQEAVRRLFESADAHPVKLPDGYQFNRDECYDE
ncbi:MAG: type II toxin-antitoxin system RelB/DinJ family antitoxin [Oscillospiraceae bacterium]|nr:type II toxin-antitoxin system RelB/DinJ family antitoxin [Oscillospiraceae bacterium]